MYGTYNSEFLLLFVVVPISIIFGFSWAFSAISCTICWSVRTKNLFEVQIESISWKQIYCKELIHFFSLFVVFLPSRFGHMKVHRFTIILHFFHQLSHFTFHLLWTNYKPFRAYDGIMHSTWSATTFTVPAGLATSMLWTAKTKNKKKINKTISCNYSEEERKRRRNHVL